MKQIISLSSIALVSLSSVAPCLATTEARSRSSNQSLSSAAKNIQLAQFGGLGGVIRTLDQGLDIKEQEQRRQEERERREQLEKERRERVEFQRRQEEELAALKRAANELQLREVERRLQYFETLSPEQKQAYIAEQRAQQKRKDAKDEMETMIVLRSIELLMTGLR